MKTFFLLLSFAAMSYVPVDAMHVVIHTRDKVVVLYVCEAMSAAAEDGPVVMRRVVSGGQLTYRGVGGVAPYTVIGQESDGVGNVCITLMDATGMMATGCGSRRVRTKYEYIECPRWDTEYENSMVTVVPSGSTPIRPLPADREVDPDPDPDPDVREREVKRVNDRGDRGIADRPVRRIRERHDPGPSPRPDRPVRNVERTRHDTGGATGTYTGSSRPTSNTNRNTYSGSGGIQRSTVR